MSHYNWRENERRKSTGGWTLWKEIIGTMIAIAPFAVILIGWGVSVEKTQSRHDAEIANLREARTEILASLRRIEDDVKAMRSEIRK